ncbi:MAG: CpaF family protein [Acidimicrobiia bacterium]|nr:CpaF family protein [Acidimicrobiia bacterium]MDH3470239.1 CpaF family protein [Acidimicrobiia bacterium]
MKLSERLKSVESDAPTVSRTQTTDPLDRLKERAQAALFSRIGAQLYDASLTEDQLRAVVRDELGTVLADENAPLSAAEQAKLVAAVSDDILGYGPLQSFLADGTVTEIMVNGDNPIFIEQNGMLNETGTRFHSEEHLRRVIERIVGQVGRRIDESSPMVDARLPDGSRVNAIIPPLAVDGPALTIRKFSKDPFQVADLVRMGTITDGVAEFLDACVRGRLNILISGGTGTGKTTLLNVVSGFIPDDQRIVTIEDAVELQLHQRHFIRLESRPPNIEGKGQITIRDLVRNSLRMRPDRIVVGEVRGGETLDMLQAMNTGHDGSLSTIHANSPRDAVARIETMVLMSGLDLPIRAIREQTSSALDMIVHLSRMRDGSRRITHITEVVGMEGEVVTLQDIFSFDYEAGVDEDGRIAGSVRPTGLRPQFVDQLAGVGVTFDPTVFGAPTLHQAA